MNSSEKNLYAEFQGGTANAEDDVISRNTMENYGIAPINMPPQNAQFSVGQSHMNPYGTLYNLDYYSPSPEVWGGVGGTNPYQLLHNLNYYSASTGAFDNIYAMFQGGAPANPYATFTGTYRNTGGGITSELEDMEMLSLNGRKISTDHKLGLKSVKIKTNKVVEKPKVEEEEYPDTSLGLITSAWNFLYQQVSGVKGYIDRQFYKLQHLEETNMKLGLRHFCQRNWLDARFRFWFMYKMWPENLEAQFLLALADFADGKLHKMRPILVNILKLDSKYTKAKVLLTKLDAMDFDYIYDLIDVYCAQDWE